MSDPLYRKDLLRLAADAHGAGRLAKPDSTGLAVNPACGDRVSVELNIHDGRIVAIAHETRACVLAQASASILGKVLHGATRTDVESLRLAVEAMLQQASPPPPAPCESFSAFEGAVDHERRHACVLLPIRAVLNAFDDASRISHCNFPNQTP